MILVLERISDWFFDVMVLVECLMMEVDESKVRELCVRFNEVFV